jgi:hypothetical protein
MAPSSSSQKSPSVEGTAPGRDGLDLGGFGCSSGGWTSTLHATSPPPSDLEHAGTHQPVGVKLAATHQVARDPTWRWHHQGTVRTISTIQS